MALLMQKDCLSPLLQYSPSSGQLISNTSTWHCGRRPAYSEICTALIEAVHSVHPVHADIATDLQRTSAFASVFPTGVSLNYDLTLYWAMLLLNAAHGS